MNGHTTQLQTRDVLERSAALVQPRHLVARMPDRGDLRITIDGPYTYLHIADLEHLVEGSAVDNADRGVATLPDALDWARERGPRGVEFAEWVQAFLAGVDDVVLEQAHRIPSFVDAVTVRKAAQLLDADPAISIGRRPSSSTWPSSGGFTARARMPRGS